MTSPLPLLSVITVVWNAGEAIETTLASVAADKSPRIEYLVYDGGSTDDTLDRIRRLGSAIDQLRSEPDRGIYDAMNKGIRDARGDWLYFLNAGDRLHPGMLERLLEEALTLGPDFLAVSGRVRMVDPQGTALGYTHPVQRGSMERLLTSNCVAHQATLVSRRAFESLGGYEHQYRIMGDYEFWIRMLSAGMRIHFVDLVVADFVADGVSSQRQRFLQAQWERLDILKKHGLLGSWTARLCWWQIRAAYGLKSFLRGVLGQALSQRIALARARRG